MAVFGAYSSVSVLQIAVLVVGQMYRNSAVSGALVVAASLSIAQTNLNCTLAFR